MRKLSKYGLVLLFSVIIVAAMASSAKAYDPVVVTYVEGEGEIQKTNSYQITLVSVVYENGVQNWTYRVCCLSGHGISHIVIEFKTVCDPPLSAILEAGPGNVEISEDYDDADPTTGAVGIKYEFTSLEPGECALVWFTLNGEWPIGDISVYIKADAIPPENLIGTLEGPQCVPDHEIPEVPLGAVMATASMLIAFGAYFGLRRRKTLLSA